MKTNEVVTFINLIGVDAKAVRDYARKYFVKTDGGWDFNESQVNELNNHFKDKWNKREEMISQVKADTKIEALTNKRNAIVKEWDAKMEPLRKQREEGTLTSWEEWDALTEEMQVKTAEVDHELFQLGALN